MHIPERIIQYCMHTCTHIIHTVIEWHACMHNDSCGMHNKALLPQAIPKRIQATIDFCAQTSSTDLYVMVILGSGVVSRKQSCKKIFDWFRDHSDSFLYSMTLNCASIRIGCPYRFTSTKQVLKLKSTFWHNLTPKSVKCRLLSVRNSYLTICTVKWYHYPQLNYECQHIPSIFIIPFPA